MTAVANIHGIKIINVPLKTAGRHFTLYRIIVFPTRILEDNFVKYSIDFPYFSIDSSQRDYLLLAEADFSHCEASSVTICPANMAVCSVQTITIESSICLQTTASTKLCRRNLLLITELRPTSNMNTLAWSPTWAMRRYHRLLEGWHLDNSHGTTLQHWSDIQHF